MQKEVWVASPYQHIAVVTTASAADQPGVCDANQHANNKERFISNKSFFPASCTSQQLCVQSLKWARGVDCQPTIIVPWSTAGILYGCASSIPRTMPYPLLLLLGKIQSKEMLYGATDMTSSVLTVKIWKLKAQSTTKQFDNLKGFKFNYLNNVWGKGSLAKTEGQLVDP